MPSLAAAYAAAVMSALCFAATQTPALSLVHVDVPERGGIESCADEEIRGNTYVKLEEGDTHWHLYNEEGLFAIPNEELNYIEYEHCPRLLNRN